MTRLDTRPVAIVAISGCFHKLAYRPSLRGLLGKGAKSPLSPLPAKIVCNAYTALRESTHFFPRGLGAPPAYDFRARGTRSYSGASQSPTAGTGSTQGGRKPSRLCVGIGNKDGPP